MSDWNTSSLTYMDGAFRVTPLFTGDGLSKWDTSNVVSLLRTFKATPAFDGQGIANWNTHALVDLYYTFDWSTVNVDLSSWDVSSVTMAEGVFKDTDLNPCFKRFIHDAWFEQGLSIYESTWSYETECARTLRDALFRDFSCFDFLSNVSAVEELVSSIENQRHYEINIKMITTARDMDESSTSLLTLPS